MNSELLQLIQALGSALTPDNINTAVSLVEKLITLAETIKKDIDLEMQPSTTPSKN